MRHLNHVLEHKFAEFWRDGALEKVDATALDVLENVGCIGPVLHKVETVLVVFEDLPGLDYMRRSWHTLDPSVDHLARVCVVLQISVHVIFVDDFDHVLRSLIPVIQNFIFPDARDHTLHTDKATNLKHTQF